MENVLGILVIMLAGGLFALLIALKNFIYICRPNEILIISGGANKDVATGDTGIRIVTGGWTFRKPIIEHVDRMDMTLISVSMSIDGAYSEGGIPLSLKAIANIKVSSDPKFINNAVERFLGRGRSEIARVAKETLEGHLRGVLAEMTPEEVNEDRLKFADSLAKEAINDLQKLGLQLDTLKIQHVADDVSYLDNIGRQQIAVIHKEAEVAESDAARAAEKAEAEALGRGGVAKEKASAAIKRSQNELRQIKAELDAKARSEEERAEMAAQEARAQAEKELQGIRAELAQLRYEAERVIPAQMELKARKLLAAGEAAPVAENGRAMAASLSMLTDAWKDCGDQAMEMFVLQRIDKILGSVAEAATQLDVGEVSLIDSGDGSTVGNYVRTYPAIVSSVLQEICSTLGVDIAGALSGRIRHDAAALVAAAQITQETAQA